LRRLLDRLQAQLFCQFLPMLTELFLFFGHLVTSYKRVKFFDDVL
jgi:hypothetical protein